MSYARNNQFNAIVTNKSQSSFYVAQGSFEQGSIVERVCFVGGEEEVREHSMSQSEMDVVRTSAKATKADTK